MMATSEKPFFNDSKMVSIANELGVSPPGFTVVHLQKPTCDFVVMLYSNLLEVMDIELPNASEVHEFQNLQYPEMHKNLMQLGMLAKSIAFIFKMIGSNLDFRISDLVKPTSQRHRIFLSQYLNFLMYGRENAANLENANKARRSMAARMETMKKSKDELRNKYAKAMAEKGEREEKIRDFDKRMAAAEATIKKQEEEKLRKQTTLAELDAELVDLQQRIADRQRARDDKQAFVRNLESQLVTSPDRVKGELGRVQEGLEKLTTQVEEKEATLNERKQLVAYLETYLQKATEVQKKAHTAAKLVPKKKAKQVELEKMASGKQELIAALEKSNLESCSMSSSITKALENETAVKRTCEDRHRQVVEINTGYLKERERLEDMLDATEQRVIEVADEQEDLEREKNELQSCFNQARETMQQMRLNIVNVHETVKKVYEKKTSELDDSTSED